MALATTNNSHSHYRTYPGIFSMVSKNRYIAIGAVIGILGMSFLIQERFFPKQLLKPGAVIYVDGKRLKIED